MVLIPVFNGKDDTDSVVRDVTALRKIVPRPTDAPLAAYVTGQAGFDADRALAVEGIDGTLLAITGILVLVLMLLDVPLAADRRADAGGRGRRLPGRQRAGLRAGRAALTTVSGQSTAILIVLMFGAGTDYALLIVSRYRDELRRTGDVDAAIARAAERTTPAILASGGIVVAAMLVLGLADFNATREMGPILALGIVVMMAGGLTLLPAVLAVLGRRAFWPAIPPLEPEYRAGETRGWVRIGALVRRRPWLLAGVSLAILAAGALGNLDGRGYLALTEQYRDAPESVQGQQLIAERFPPGRVAPVDVLASGNAALAGQGGVPAPEDRLGLQHRRAVDRRQPDLARDPAEDRSVLRRARWTRSRRCGRRRARRGKDGTVLVGGVTAEQHDNLEALRSDTKLIAPLVLLLILLVLMVLLRAVVAPLYVVGTVVLSFAFALGASSLIFTHIFGQPDSDPNLTIFAFIFLVALGVDDNIFLMTGIREQHARGLATRDAVIVGLQRTGGVITSAGLILAGTFAALMALDLEALFQVGFTVTLGLLVDAFLVRTFLVPSIALPARRAQLVAARDARVMSVGLLTQSAKNVALLPSRSRLPRVDNQEGERGS